MNFQIGVIEAYFSQKYSCITYDDNDMEKLSDFLQFYYGSGVCVRNLGTMLAVTYDSPTAVSEAFQILRTNMAGQSCDNCSCIEDDTLVEAALIVSQVLKTGESAGNTDGCGPTQSPTISPKTGAPTETVSPTSTEDLITMLRAEIIILRRKNRRIIRISERVIKRMEIRLLAMVEKVKEKRKEDVKIHGNEIELILERIKGLKN